jgi:hypothetical protein
LSLPINQRRFLYKSPIVAQPLTASHNAGSREWGPVQTFIERDILQYHTAGKGGRLQVCFFCDEAPELEKRCVAILPCVNFVGVPTFGRNLAHGRSYRTSYPRLSKLSSTGS